MQTVATNIRFEKSEYEELKRLAFLEKASIASLIRSAVRQYKLKKASGVNENKRLLNLMLKSRIKVDVSTVELAHTDRKFE